MSQKKEIKMELSSYVRKPFNVDAVRVTSSNIEELAEKVDGNLDQDQKGKFINVPVKKVLDEKQRRAYIGDWVLEYQGGWKVYNNRAFRASFEAAGASARVTGESLERLSNIFNQTNTVTQEDLQVLQQTVNHGDMKGSRR